MCKRGTVAAGTFQRVYSNKFKVYQNTCDASLSSAATYITDVGFHDATTNPSGYFNIQRYDTKPYCFFRLRYDTEVIESPSCPVVQRSVFLAQNDLTTLVTQFPDPAKADTDNHGFLPWTVYYYWDGINYAYWTERNWAYY